MSDIRPIDANALPNYKCQVTATVGDRKAPAEMRFVFWQDIEQAHTIDAVSVVRCRECKWCELLPISSYCAMWGSITRRNGFCYRGEKTDGGATDEN